MSIYPLYFGLNNTVVIRIEPIKFKKSFMIDLVVGIQHLHYIKGIVAIRVVRCSTICGGVPSIVTANPDDMNVVVIRKSNSELYHIQPYSSLV